MTAHPAIGGLNDRVQVQKRVETTEDEGGHAVVFMPLVTLWARVTALGVSRSAAADARGATVTHTVVIRHRGGVMPGDRFVWQGRSLEVLSAEDISGRRRYLACRCSERRVSG